MYVTPRADDAMSCSESITFGGEMVLGEGLITILNASVHETGICWLLD